MANSVVHIVKKYSTKPSKVIDSFHKKRTLQIIITITCRVQYFISYVY